MKKKKINEERIHLHLLFTCFTKLTVAMQGLCYCRRATDKQLFKQKLRRTELVYNYRSNSRIFNYNCFAWRLVVTSQFIHHKVAIKKRTRKSCTGRSPVRNIGHARSCIDAALLRGGKSRRGGHRIANISSNCGRI